ncbi:MAG: PaaI family thioesterase [Actinomycetota bacterium]
MDEPALKSAPPIWREPVRGGPGDPRGLGLSGAKRMQYSVEGRFRPPPIHHLTGLRPTSSGEGTSGFTMPATGWLQSPVGVFLGGVLAFLADAPLGGAIITALPPKVVATTSELSMNYLRPAGPGSGELFGDARLVHAGRSLGLSEVSIRDSQGRMLAHGSSRCFLITYPVEEMDHIPEPFEPEVFDTPDPYLRPVVGETIDTATLARYSGVDAMRAFIAGELPMPPSYYLTGIAPRFASDSSCTWVMPASPWMSSPTGMLYGGALAWVMDVGLTGAVSLAAAPGDGYALLDMKIHFLRPAVPDGSDLIVNASITHRGKTFVVVNGEIMNTAGKRVAVAAGSGMLLPGRMAERHEPLEPADEVSQETLARLRKRSETTT